MESDTAMCQVYMSGCIQITVTLSHSKPGFCCAMLCKCDLCCPVVSVTFVEPVETYKCLQNFFTIWQPRHSSFPYQTSWQYSDEDPLIDIECRQGRQKSQYLAPSHAVNDCNTLSCEVHGKLMTQQLLVSDGGRRRRSV